MSDRANDRDAESLSCYNIAGSIEASDIGIVACTETSIRPLCPPEPKFNELDLVADDSPHATSISSDQRGIADQVNYK